MNHKRQHELQPPQHDIMTCHKQLNANFYIQLVEPGCSKPPVLPLVTKPTWD